MTQRSAKRKQFLADVLTTAVEGGINYWSHVSEYQWASPDLGRSDGSSEPVTEAFASVLVWEDEEPDKGARLVTLDTIAHGLTLYRQLSYAKKAVLEADRTNGEVGDYDADDADNILQLGIFDKVVYG